MTIAPGARLGIYEITAKLGEGGMGTVWRATDTTLEREVAIKLLPDDFADDPERHARFEREAKLLASLNHPNIAVLHALEHLEGQHALVMELVEGEGLDELIARGPVPVDEAIPVALQIAEALEAAHEHGIVHRDLKPANVRIRPDGTVKVLDFGLATTWDAAGESGLTHSPTITRAHTAAGVILGTAAYMSPEQARGKAVDKRADIWAFGALLWEMLTGRRLFAGETVTDVLANVLKHEIDWPLLPPATPAPLRRLLHRCLERDPRRRLRDMGDAEVELVDAAEASSPDEGLEGLSAAGRKPRPRLVQLAGALGLAVAALAVLAFWQGWGAAPAAPPAQRVVSELVMPEGWVLDASAGPPALSPDGRQLAFLASPVRGPTSIFVRSFNSATARRIEDTAGGQMAFWSPDGRTLGFFADGKLKRIDVNGGRAEALADAPAPYGASWAPDDTIIFEAHYHAPPRTVAASGGPVRQLPPLFPDLSSPWYLWPRILPDGKHYIVGLQDLGGERSGLYVASLSGEPGPRRLTRTISRAELIEPGRLLFAESGSLKVFPFDPTTLTLGRESTRVAEVAWAAYLCTGVFSVSPHGTLVYQPGSGRVGDTELVTVDRSGRDVAVVGPLAEYYAPRISHNGRFVAVDSTLMQTTQGDVWVFDLERGTRTRLAASPRDESSPVWSPDDSAVFYRRVPDLFARDVAGAQRERQVFSSDLSKKPTDLSPDGRTLLFEVDVGDDLDLWALDMESGKARPWLDQPYREESGRFSPDGRWVAYDSEESGVAEVYVRSFPDAGRRIVVSTEGGVSPVWRADGRELLYYSAASEIMAVPVSWHGEAPRFGRPQALFHARLREGGQAFDVFPDGHRLLLDRVVPSNSVDHLVMVQSWSAEAEVR